MNRRPLFWLSGLAALALAFVVGAFAATSVLVLMRSPRAAGTISTAARLGGALAQAGDATDPDDADDPANAAEVVDENDDAADGDGDDDAEHPCGDHDVLLRVHPGMAAFAGLDDGTIADVTEDGPAAAAGLEAGDRITAIDGVPVDDGGLADAIGARKPGETVALTVARGDETLDLKVTLAAHPDDAEKGFLGVMLGGPMRIERRLVGPDGEPFMLAPGFGMHGPGDMALPEALRKRLEGLEDGARLKIAGAVVTGATADGPAAAAGLAEGDVIEAIDGEALGSPMALAEALAAHAPGDVVTLTVSGADGASREVPVTLGERQDDADKAWLGVELGPFIKIDRTDDGEGDVRFEFGTTPHMPGLRWFSDDEADVGHWDEAAPAVPALPAVIAIGSGGTL